MTKIGILTCSNTTQGLACSSSTCFKEMYAGEGGFAAHAEKGGAELAGIINCSGCPTVLAPEKILGRVQSLVNGGVEAIHLSSCLMALCPFKNKYLSLLKDRFPELNVLEGTHSAPPGVSPQTFQKVMKELISRPKATMADVGRKIAEEMEAASN